VFQYSRLTRFIGVLTFVVVGLFLFFALFWLIRTSLTPASELFDTNFRWLPSHYTLHNFWHALHDTSLKSYVYNSLLDAGGAGVIATALATYAAYGLVMFGFRFSRGLMGVFLLAQAFPSALILLSLYPAFIRLHLTNSHLGLMLAYVVLSLPSAIYIMHSFLVRFPTDTLEAARLDGCGEFRAFHTIVFPVIRPSLIAVWLFSFMWGWNDLLFSLTLTSSDRQKTIGPGLLSTYLGQFTDDWGGIMSASILASLPVVVLFAFLQRTFIRGITAGSVKG
jgi:multiple sugar transport system permease protein